MKLAMGRVEQENGAKKKQNKCYWNPKACISVSAQVPGACASLGTL